MDLPADPIPALAADQATPQNKSSQRAHTFLFLAAAAVAALCIDFGAFHRLHNSDSIVPVMMSLWRWTPYYWEQDRFGMLVPLLTIPFKSPLANLLAQSAINAFCGLATFFLCARYVVRRAWLVTGAVSACIFLLFATERARFLYLGLQQPYGVGMFLGLGGLLLLENSESSRLLPVSFSFICLLAASWVDGAVIFVLLPLILFRWLFERDARENARGTENVIVSPGGRRSSLQKLVQLAKSFVERGSGLAVLLVLSSFAVTFVYSGMVSRSVAYGEWPYAPVRPWNWPAVWFQFGKYFWLDYLKQLWGIALAALLAVGVIVRLPQRGKIRGLNPSAASLLASSVVSFLLIGSLSHIQDMTFDPRFGLQSMVLLQVGAAAWAVLPIQALLGVNGRRALVAASMCLFLGAPLCLYGWPSLAKVRGDLDSTLGQYTPEILQSGATQIVGDYWNVWPATFHANMTLYEMGSNRKIWGVTVRSGPTEKFWSQIPADKMRLAAIAGDPAVPYTLNMFSFPPVTEVGGFKTISVYKAAQDSDEPLQ
jgi:hypothetical protein